MAKHVLITGFEPFGNDRVNPSEMVARALDGSTIAGRLIAVRVLPVETRTLRDRLEEAVRETRPDIAICLGQAGGRPAVALERVALNVLDFDQPDAVGVMRKGDPIARGGPDARLSNLPFENVLEAWRAAGVPGYVSNSAGTFLCNQALYEIIALTEHTAPPVIAGFAHLPYLPAQAIAADPERHPSMSFELMKKAIETLIETIVPWIEHRAPQDMREQPKGKNQMWIPRGMKEVER